MATARQLRDEFLGRDKPPAKTEQRGGTSGKAGGARGTVYDSNGRLHVVPIEDVLTKDGRWRGPKGQR